jgi:4-amino-4-deoxy-L-arabinose transferase-like glycosyltransferase
LRSGSVSATGFRRQRGGLFIWGLLSAFEKVQTHSGVTAGEDLRLFKKETPFERRMVLALIALSALVRISVVVAVIDSPYDPYVRLDGDSAEYLALGMSLSRGEGFSPHYAPVLTEILGGTPFPQPPERPIGSRSPGYPAFLALFFALAGYRLHLLLLVQAFISVATALLVYLIARELKGRGLLALAFAAMYVPFWFDAAYVMTECLLTFATSLALWLLVRPGRELPAGLAAGAVILIKSVTLPFFALIPLVLGRRAWRFLLGFLLVVAPWAARNDVHTGVPYLTASHSGYQIFLLHNPLDRDFAVFERPGDQNEGYRNIQAVAQSIRDRAPRVADPVAQEFLGDRELFLDALRYIAADKAQAAQAIWESLANTWRIDIPAAHWRSGYGFPSAVRWCSNLVLYVCLVPLAVVGALRLLRHGTARETTIILFLLYFIAVHSLLSSQVRHRVSAFPAFFVLAACGASPSRAKSAQDS